MSATLTMSSSAAAESVPRTLSEHGSVAAGHGSYHLELIVFHA